MMTNKAYLLLWSIITSSLFIALSLHAPTGACAEIITGEYLLEDYIKEIDNAKSPCAAAMKYTKLPTAISVKKKKDGYDLTLLYNFHEGGARLFLNKKGAILARDHGINKVSNIAIKINSDKSFTLSNMNKQPTNYIFTGNSEKYVANKLLVGDYIDAKGSKYSFKADGHAILGKSKILYTIGLDCVHRTDKTIKIKDYIQNAKTNEVYAFKINDGALYLYKTSEEDQIVANRPFAILQKIEK